jgi:hypothetical protein
MCVTFRQLVRALVQAHVHAQMLATAEVVVVVAAVAVHRRRRLHRVSMPHQAHQLKALILCANWQRMTTMC